MNDWNYIFESPSRLDSREFKEYARLIESIIHSQPDDADGRPGTITIRGIHEALCEEARPPLDV